jgi:flagellar hook-associated protein 3 FlgL
MRITNSLTSDRLTRDIQRQYAELADIQQQVSTGHKVNQMSDDPLSGQTVLRTSSAQRALTQFGRSVSSVRTRLDAEETTINQVGDILSRAKELATAQSGSTGNAQSRAAAAAELNSLFDQVVSLGNLKIGDEHLFGGTAGTAAPFQADGTYVGTAASRQAEIADGVVVSTVHSGQQLLVDSGVLSSLNALKTAMAANDPVAIRAAMSPLDAAISNNQTNLAEVGARANTLDSADAARADLSSSLTKQQSAAQDADMPTAITRLATVQASLQGALLAASKILNTNLTQYLQ